MKKELENIELIENYVENRMTTEQRIEFDLRLLVDDELRADFDLYQKIVSGFHDMKAEKIRENLKLIDLELDKGKAGSVKNRKFWWGLGLAAIISVVILLVYPRNSDLIPLPPEDGLPVLMGEPNPTLLFDDAMQQFKTGNFINSKSIFDELIKLHPSNDTILYYKGYSEMRAGLYKNAITSFNALILNEQSTYIFKTRYYLAYSYYQTGQLQKASSELWRLSQYENNPLASETKKFLSIINEK